MIYCHYRDDPFHTDVNRDDIEPKRRRLLAEIASDAALTAIDTGRRTFSGGVMAALGKVDRHRFVPEYLADSAYGNYPLPIGNGQTIS